MPKSFNYTASTARKQTKYDKKYSDGLLLQTILNLVYNCDYFSFLRLFLRMRKCFDFFLSITKFYPSFVLIPDSVSRRVSFKKLVLDSADKLVSDPVLEPVVPV